MTELKLVFMKIKKGVVTDHMLRERMKKSASGYSGFSRPEKASHAEERVLPSSPDRMEKLSIQEEYFLRDIVKSPFSGISQR